MMLVTSPNCIYHVERLHFTFESLTHPERVPMKLFPQ
jgi:hypothetical protein